MTSLCELAPESKFVEELYANATVPEEHLWMHPKTVEPGDATQAFESFVDFMRYHGYNNPLHSGSVGERQMIFWSWVPSVPKAYRDGITSIIDNFDDVREDDPQSDYAYGDIGQPHNDLRIDLNYHDDDYLILIIQKYNNGYRQEIFKITVKDQDEPIIYAFLKIMLREFVTFNGVL